MKKLYGIITKYELLDKIPQNDSIRKLIKDISSVMEDETRMEIIDVLQNTMHDVRMGKIVEREKAKKVSKMLVEEILENKEAMIKLMDIRNFDDYTFTHSINVCILSITTAINMDFNKDELEEIALGALLHDIGKILIPNEILNKEEALNKEEFEKVKEHPYEGYSIISRSKEFGKISRMIAYEHHERFDGSGYPRGLAGHGIEKIATIVSLADVYDALTTNRPYRNKFLPYEAVKIILSGSYKLFDANVVKPFIKNISIYPSGSLVKLNTGEVGMVVKINKFSLIRPMIRILGNKSGEILEEILDVDLMEDKKRFIVGPTDRYILPD